jgi:hypothetical protein
MMAIGSVRTTVNRRRIDVQAPPVNPTALVLHRTGRCPDDGYPGRHGTRESDGMATPCGPGSGRSERQGHQQWQPHDDHAQHGLARRHQDRDVGGQGRSPAPGAVGVCWSGRRPGPGPEPSARTGCAPPATIGATGGRPGSYPRTGQVVSAPCGSSAARVGHRTVHGRRALRTMRAATAPARRPTDAPIPPPRSSPPVVPVMSMPNTPPRPAPTLEAAPGATSPGAPRLAGSSADVPDVGMSREWA